MKLVSSRKKKELQTMSNANGQIHGVSSESVALKNVIIAARVVANKLRTTRKLSDEGLKEMFDLLKSIEMSENLLARMNASETAGVKVGADKA